MDVAGEHKQMKPLTNRCALADIGTTGTEIRDKRVANPGLWWLLGLVLVACGGESKHGDDTSGSDNTSDGVGGTEPSGNASNGNASNGNASTVGSTGSSGGLGPATSGTASGSGAGGNSTASSEDTTSVSSGGSGGGAAGTGGAGGASCEPQDVGGVGACDAAFGVFFLGDRCGWVSGCSCEGDDCDNAYEDEASCEAAHRDCFDDACAAQDAAFVGGCEPASLYVYNGFECVAMDGCSCVGEDCDAVYSTPEDCEAAHAVCKDRALSCDDIDTAYDDYVSHTACEDDSDCTTVYGQCAIGLGGCHHALNRHWGNSGVQALGEAWAALDCGGGVCDCPPPSETVVCDDGVCAFQE